MAAILLTSPASAHDPGLSNLDVRIDDRAITATLALKAVDLPRVQGWRRAGPEELRARLDRFFRKALEVSVDGAPCASEAVEASADDTDIRALITFARGSGSRIAVRSAILQEVLPGHRQVAAITSGEGRTVARKILWSREDRIEGDLASLAPLPSPFAGFLALGVEHILTGYDHLTFILGLLLAGGGAWATVRLITAFTVAHSISLALAALELVKIPSAIVEPLIAVSIAYVGLENIVRKETRGRPLVVFGFGLIHGLGFAGALQEVGLGSTSTGVVVPLLSFNLGVELGQLAVASLAVPLLALLGNRLGKARFRVTASAAVFLLGVAFLAARV
jgi:hydrogenase/urease accessory protein HupE